MYVKGDFFGFDGNRTFRRRSWLQEHCALSGVGQLMNAYVSKHDFRLVAEPAFVLQSQKPVTVVEDKIISAKESSSNEVTIPCNVVKTREFVIASNDGTSATNALRDVEIVDASE